MNQVKAAQRDYLFDNAKAFLILTVVIGHFQGDLSKGHVFSNGNPLWLDVVWYFIFTFHMPVFMVISGYFSKRRVQNNDWISVIDKLVAPYVVLQVCLFLLQNMLDYGSTSLLTFLSPRVGAWYIATIAAYQLITPHLLKHKHLFVFSLIVAIMSLFVLRTFYGGFQRLFTYYPFFLFGYFLSANNHDFSRYKKTSFRIISVCAFVLLTVLIVKFSNWIHPNMLSMDKTFVDVRERLAYGRVGYLIMMLIRYFLGFAFFFFTLGISSSQKRFFTFVGTHSSYVYFLHLFVYVILRALDSRYGILAIFGTTPGAIIYLLAAIPLSFFLATPFVRKRTRFIVEPDFSIKRIAKKLVE